MLILKNLVMYFRKLVMKTHNLAFDIVLFTTLPMITWLGKIDHKNIAHLERNNGTNFIVLKIDLCAHPNLVPCIGAGIKVWTYLNLHNIGHNTNDSKFSYFQFKEGVVFYINIFYISFGENMYDVWNVKGPWW